jgi:hypothetical protein
MNDATIWLPEPSALDHTYAEPGEHPLDWLARSTTDRARECRFFLNKNLSALPREARSLFMTTLNTRWSSAFFELIVARMLQELGATLLIEVENQSGKRPDFTAQFDDGAVIVEAVSPVINGDAGEVAKRHMPLLKIIKAHAPVGWYVNVWELPDLGPADSKRVFKKTVARLLSVTSSQEDDVPLDLVDELPQGRIHLQLWPARSAFRGTGVEPPLTVFDDTKERIRYAVRHKRSQVRSNNAPVILGVHASGITSEFEDFDMALFGHTFARMGWHGEVIEIGFQPDGEFTYNLGKAKPPTYAGVLAFTQVGFHRVSQPILYMHPRFSGELPGPLLSLERRTYDVENRIIRRESAKSTTWLNGLSLVQR